MNKRVRSYPSVVRVFQMGEWTSSLGVLGPRYMLKIMKQLHIDFRKRSLKLWGLSCLVNLTLLSIVP